MDLLPGGCGVPRSQQAEITIDGQSGRISECPNRIEATVVAGGRLYLFILSHDRSDARAVFDAFVATIDLTPETAVDFPALTTTFVSPTYGFSFEYFDRGGLAPATELWDPVNQPPTDINFDPAIRRRGTGLAAYFEAASTELPDGVSIDEWVDEYVSPGGCGVPRSQQAGDHHRWAVGQGLGVSGPDRGDRRRRRAALSLHPGATIAVTPGRSSTPGSPPST